MKTKIVVLGAGPGGYVAAVRAAQMGGEVVIVEKAKAGGTCLNWGCIPSKIYKQTADTLHIVRDAQKFCVTGVEGGTVDLTLLQAHAQKIIDSQIRGIEGLLKKHGVEKVDGLGKLTGPNSLIVEGADGKTRTLEFDKLIIATGSEPTGLPFLPFDGKNILSSNDIFSLDTIPASLTIIGGGVIGCEFASIMNAFGVQVNLIEGLDRLLPLPSVDEECSKLLLREMKKKKIKVEVNSSVSSATETDAGWALEINCTSKGKTTTKTVVSEKVLVCIGRRSINQALDLDKAGVKSDERGWIIASESLQTANDNIYAIGDTLGPARVMLAHSASTEAEIAVENCFGKAKTMDWSVMPSAIFTMPEIGCVGLSEQEAVEAYGADNIIAESTLFRTLGKAQVIGEIAGFCKMISDKESGKILGVHIAGPHATDILGEACLAIKLGATATQVAETIHAHPTLAEIMLETSFKVIGMPLHG